MKRLSRYFSSPLYGMLVHRRLTPSIKFAVTIYTPGRRIKCLAQEHNTLSPARVARTRTAWSGDERSDTCMFHTKRTNSVRLLHYKRHIITTISCEGKHPAKNDNCLVRSLFLWFAVIRIFSFSMVIRVYLVIRVFFKKLLNWNIFSSFLVYHSDFN